MTNKIVTALTVRETQILKLICQEKTNLEIAKKLKISEYGVDYHRRNLYRKTGAKTIIGLLKVAIKNNIVKL